MSKQQNTSRSLSMENLEDRRLMAGSIDLAGGTLSIDGTDYNDTVIVTQSGNDLNVRFYTYNSDTQAYETTSHAPINANSVSTIRFEGYGGNDYFYNRTGITSIVQGHSGNDTLVGGTGFDYINGGSGNDQMWGDYDRNVGSGDSLFGEGGDDVIYGRAGDDIIHGDNPFVFSGNDRIFGGEGNDTMHGNAGNDSLYGENGVDKLFGDAGNDRLDGGDDGVSDQMTGGAGADTFVTHGGWHQGTSLFGRPTIYWQADLASDYMAGVDSYEGQTSPFTFFNNLRIS